MFPGYGTIPRCSQVLTGMNRFYVIVAVCSLLTITVSAASSNAPIKRKALVKGKVTFTNLGKFESSTDGSRQGAAIFQNYLFQGHDGAKCDIFDFTSRKLLKTSPAQPDIAKNHLNTIDFLCDRYYRPADAFPLLYVSENNLSYFITVNRLTSLEDDFHAVQRIELPSQIGYYLNAVYDTKRGFIYTVCFKNKTWRSAAGNNCLLVSKLRLPDVGEGNVTLTHVIDQFELPFHTATQGAFFSDGLIVHGFGININAHDGIVIIDPAKRAIVREIPTHDIFCDEIEGVTAYNGAVIVTLQHGNVFRVDFK